MPQRTRDAALGLRELKKQRTRATLVDSAARLCARQGYEQTTVDQIAAAADVSPRTFSRYFPNKEAVIGAAPTQRRFKPRAKGSAGPILRRSSHISITLVGSAPEKKKRPARKSVSKKTEEAPAAAAAAAVEEQA